MSDDEPKFISSCDVCEQGFQFGAHVYDGQVIQRYGIKVCSGCYAGNWDGWAPQFEERVTANLRAAGKPIPERNAKGWLPRE